MTAIRASALVDHFYPVEASLEDLVRCRDIDCGDFAMGTFQAKIQRESSRVALIMERAGRAGHFSIRVRKTIALEAGEPMLTIRYEIEQIPPDACLHFAVEINLAGMGSDMQDGAYYYSSPNGTNLGTRDRTLDLPHTSGLSAERSITRSLRHVSLVASCRVVVLPDRDPEREQRGSRADPPVGGGDSALACDAGRTGAVGGVDRLGL